jgi:hypothetical protein
MTPEAIFAAWQVGEQTGRYDVFTALLGPHFTLFSHPLLGKFEGETARATLQELITEREVVSNNLTFSDIAVSEGPGRAIFTFTSEGTIRGGRFPYAGFNAIVIHVAGDAFVGFQEYFGVVDASWFTPS